MVAKGYTSHNMLADELAAFYGNERDLRVLDVGAGTGRMGQAVSRLGKKRMASPIGAFI